METLYLDDLIQRLEELRELCGGKTPVYFMDPMQGNALPMSTEQIEDHEDHIEIWPDV